MDDYQDDYAPTMTDQVREWAWQYGQERTDEQWICSPYDSWERNPHYVGEDQPHPESY